jgi:hypothetical protein
VISADHNLIFEVITAIMVSIVILWVVAACYLVGGYQ